MDAKITEASLAEKQAHTELMKAHAALMRAQTRQVNAEAEGLEQRNHQ